MKTKRKIVFKNKLQWRVDTPALLSQIMGNEGVGILKVPINIFRLILIQLSEIALEINNDELNAIMLRLALYEIPHKDKKAMAKINTYIRKHSKTKQK